MSRRVLSIGSITNQPSSHFNAYKSGSGVGGTSASVRRALQRRATLNSGTMANPKSGTCTALCNKIVVTSAAAAEVNNDGFLFLIDDNDWNTIVGALGSNEASVPIIPISMLVNTIPNYQNSGKTRVQVIFTYSHTTANTTGFNKNKVLTDLSFNQSLYDIEITQWAGIPFVNNGSQFTGDPIPNYAWIGKNTASDTPVFLANTSLSNAFINVTIPSADFGNIGSWDVSGVTNMSATFYLATNFNQDISNWNVSNVSSMSAMFGVAGAFNQNIGAWDVTNVNTMAAMFQRASTFNQDISGWNVSNVNSMIGMFQQATAFNQNIGAWDISNVTTTVNMFNSAFNFNQDLGSWNISNIINMGGMFGSSPMDSTYNINSSRTLAGWYNLLNSGVSGNPSLLASPPIGWPGSLFDFSYVFIGNDASFNEAGQAYPAGGGATYGPVGRWNVSKLTDMSEGFQNNATFNEDISMWDTANVRQMWTLFSGATAFNQDIGNWDTSSLENANNMFDGATAFNQDISGWNISNLTSASGMLDSCGISDDNYSNLLIGWASQAPNILNNVPLNASAKYNTSAAPYRAILVGALYNWTITDEGPV